MEDIAFKILLNSISISVQRKRDMHIVGGQMTNIKLLERKDNERRRKSKKETEVNGDIGIGLRWRMEFKRRPFSPLDAYQQRQQ
jgi:hypothetical protein